MTKSASYLAKRVVQGYIAHDRKKDDEASKCFSDIIGPLFPSRSKEDVKKAAASMTKALFEEDVITEAGYDKKEQLTHPHWKDVEFELLGFCDALEVPPEYAVETKDFWSLHSVERTNGRYKWNPDKEWVAHCLLADKHFVEAILRTNKFTGVLGSLYLTAVACHDMRDKDGRLAPEAVLIGNNIMTEYYSILLENMP